MTRAGTDRLSEPDDVAVLVRESLRHQATAPPRLVDPAGQALDGALAVHRRRAVAATAVATAVVVAVVAGGLFALRGDGHAGPTIPAPPAGPPVASPSITPATPVPVDDPSTEGTSLIINGRLLRLPRGGAVDLSAIPGRVTQAYRVHDDWLLQGYDTASGDSSLWLATLGGDLRSLITSASGSIAVSADGWRIAWRSGDHIRYGHLTGGQVTTDRDTEAPPSVYPQSIIEETVLLGRTETGGGLLGYDVWRTDQGWYEPSWERSAHVVAVYGPAPGGRTFLGLIRQPGTGAGTGGKGLCLASLDPSAGLRATRTACGVIDVADRNGPISPDGRWLAVQAAGVGGRGRIALIDLRSVFDTPRVSGYWNAESPGAWLDASTMLTRAPNGSLQRLRFSHPDPEPVVLPDVPAGATIGWVTRYG